MEYRVLARKYRPSSFADLIGQEVLVRTLSNAIERQRLAHAFLLTGIRGIGKTTTARIIARALNCEQGPTITPCGVCANCKMIAEDRHPDVLEMDAASRTGVNDIRELIETVHYAPTSARYKIYIIDEVHMLSTSAFNALLKTLEEPPPHVKFVFATTESRKIPVTILSRCQRFDLKRITQEMLAAHLSNITRKEGMEISPEASALLAQAAEGSVRDGLSLLDQAISQAVAPGEAIGEEAVRGMLGLADKSQTLEILELAVKGDAPGALNALRALHDAGADSLLVMQDLLEFTHFITRIKLVPAVAKDVAYAEAERVRASELAVSLSLPVLTRLWQMLLKGVSEVKMAPSPVTAAEMALVRAAYAAELPTPAEIVRSLQESGAATALPTEKKTLQLAEASPQPWRAERNNPPVLPAEPRVAASALPPRHDAPPPDFPAFVALLAENREPLISSQLRQFARVEKYQPGELAFAMKTEVTREFISKLTAAAERITGMSWKISHVANSSAPTLQEQMEQARAGRIEQAAREPLVARLLEQFPGAEVVDVSDAIS